MQQTLERAYKESHTPEIAGLELNTLKMAMNITFQDLRSILVPFFFNQVDFKNALTSVKKVCLNSNFSDFYHMVSINYPFCAFYG